MQKRFEFIKRPSDALKYVKLTDGYVQRFAQPGAPEGQKADDYDVEIYLPKYAKQKDMWFFNAVGIFEPIGLAIRRHGHRNELSHMIYVQNDFETDEPYMTDILRYGLVKAYGKTYINALGKYLHEQADKEVEGYQKFLDDETE